MLENNGHFGIGEIIFQALVFVLCGKHLILHFLERTLSGIFFEMAHSLANTWLGFSYIQLEKRKKEKKGFN